MGHEEHIWGHRLFRTACAVGSSICRSHSISKMLGKCICKAPFDLLDFSALFPMGRNIDRVVKCEERGSL